MPRTTISFPAYSLRNLKTPFGRKPGYRNCVAVVEVQDLPDLSKWRRINVRDPKLTGALPREIRDRFLCNHDTFVILNRGIVLAVDGVRFKKSAKFPFALRDVDPLTYYPVLGEDGVEACLEITQRPRRLMMRKYGMVEDGQAKLTVAAGAAASSDRTVAGTVSSAGSTIF